MPKFYYNGVLLPEIPQDVLAEYPYCWIRKNTTSGNYDLVFGKQSWYYNNGVYCQNETDEKWYTIPIATSTDATAWNFNKTTTGFFVVDTARFVFWSNHNIPNGSATSTTIYFVGTYLIPELPNDNSKLSCGDVLVPEFPQEVVDYPYCVVLCWNNGNVQLICSKSGFYFNGGTVIADRNNATLKAYNLKNEQWVEDSNQSLKYSSWTVVSNGTLVLQWSNHNIPNGSATATDIYFVGSEPIVESPSTGKYLIRSQGVLYTINDGALSPLETTELTSDIFQSYGFDKLPEWSVVSELVNPEVLYWQSSTEAELPTIISTMTATPYPQTVISPNYSMTDDTILGVECVYVTASSDVVFAISVDDGVTWYMWTGQAWGTLTDTATGMTAETINAITTEQWAELMTTGQFKVRMTLFDENSSFTSFVMDYIN